MNEVPILPVPTTSIESDVSDKATFTEYNAQENTAFLVRKFGSVNILDFINNYDKAKLTPEDKQKIVGAARTDIAWVKRKLAFKLRKPMWQDENNPRSKDKLIRMFNKYTKKRLDLLSSLGETL